MRVPPGFSLPDKSPANTVLRLNKSLYGLCQAARVWYQTLDLQHLALSVSPLTTEFGMMVNAGFLLTLMTCYW